MPTTSRPAAASLMATCSPPGPEAQDDDVDLDVGRLRPTVTSDRCRARAKQNSP